MQYERGSESIAKIGEISQHLSSYKRKEQKAKEQIRIAFERCKNPYLALSGGKDSVAMAGLVNEVAREMGREFVIWGHVSDASFPFTEDIMRLTAEKCGRELVISRSEVSAFDVIRDGSAKQFGKKGYFFTAIEEFINTGKDLAFVGVRAYESARRMRAVRVHGYNFESSVPVYCKICYPLAWFKYEDVAAALMKYNMPLHPIYAKVNVNSSMMIRLGYVTAKDLLHQGHAVFIKRNYPELYDKLVEAYPEVKNYV